MKSKSVELNPFKTYVNTLIGGADIVRKTLFAITAYIAVPDQDKLDARLHALTDALLRLSNRNIEETTADLVKDIYQVLYYSGAIDDKSDNIKSFKTALRLTPTALRKKLLLQKHAIIQKVYKDILAKNIKMTYEADTLTDLVEIDNYYFKSKRGLLEVEEALPKIVSKMLSCKSISLEYWAS